MAPCGHAAEPVGTDALPLTTEGKLRDILRTGEKFTIMIDDASC